MEIIESSRIGQCFHVFSVQGRQIYPFDEMIDIFKEPVFLSFFNNGSSGRFSHSFYGSEAETDISARGDGKIQVTFVHVGTENRDAHSPAFIHELGDFLNIGKVSAQHGCHEFGRVVGFEPGGLVGNIGIAG